MLILISLSKISNLFNQASLFNQLLAYEPDRLRLKRFRNIITRPQLHSLNCLFDISESSDENNVGIGILFSDVTGELEAINARHFHIRDDNCELLFGKFLNRLFATGCRNDFVAFLRVKPPQLLP